MASPAAQGSSAPRSTVNRTDVQSDLLADRIERWFIQLKPVLPWILVAIIAIVTVSIIVSMVAGQAAKKEATGWSDFYFDQFAPGSLESLSEDFQGTAAAQWADQIAADSKLYDALSRITLERDLALQKVKEARAAYESVAQNSRDPMLTLRANLGIAKTYDIEGNTEQAVQSYNKVLGLPGVDERLQQAISQQVTFIQSEQGKEFYAWFKENKSPAPPRPTGVPSDLKQLPSSPDFQFSPDPSAPFTSGAPTPGPDASSGGAFKLPDPNATPSVESAPATPEGTIPPVTPEATTPPATNTEAPTPATIEPSTTEGASGSSSDSPVGSTDAKP